jgi:hypothetical protein
MPTLVIGGIVAARRTVIVSALAGQRAYAVAKSANFA